MNIKKVLRLFDFSRVEDMSVLAKRRTGLPMNIYLDECERGAPHWKKVKFQPNTKDKFNWVEDCYTMSIWDSPEIVKKTWMKNELSSKDIDLLKRWIVANKDLLLRLASNDPLDLVDFIEKSTNASDLV